MDICRLEIHFFRIDLPFVEGGIFSYLNKKRNLFIFIRLKQVISFYILKVSCQQIIIKIVIRRNHSFCFIKIPMI